MKLNGLLFATLSLRNDYRIYCVARDFLTLFTLQMVMAGKGIISDEVSVG